MNSWPSGTRAWPTILPSIMAASALADQNKANMSETPSISSPRLIHISRRPRWGTAGDNIWMLGGLKGRRVELHQKSAVPLGSARAGQEPPGGTSLE